MNSGNIARFSGSLALALCIAAPAAAQKIQAPAQGTSYGIQISMPAHGKSSGKPAAGDSRSAAVSVFRTVPKTVRLTAAKGVRLSLSKRRPGSSKLSVSTGGTSKCVRVFAHTAGADPMPLAFAIVKKGDRDPCTGAAPAGTVRDLTTTGPAPQPFTHVYWKLRCRKGQGCHWIKVICTHAPGVP
jgi:hypothetical protein